MKGVPLGVISPVKSTDTSLLGLGAVWQRRTIKGRWSRQQRLERIHLLELRAIYLQHFLPSLKDQHVLIWTDSTLAVYHINHQGSTRSRQDLQVLQQLLMWALPPLSEPQGLTSPRSAEQSCQGPPQGDWRLHPEVIEMIWSRYGRVGMDVFALETSTHCPL